MNKPNWSVTLYKGATCIEAKKKTKGNEYGFTEIIVPGETKFIYIIKQLQPQIGFLGTEDDPVVCKFFKIGYASKPIQRLRNIKSSNPFDVELIFEYETPQPKTLEFIIYHWFHFHGFHHAGEWFIIPQEEMEVFIDKEFFNIFVENHSPLGFTEGARLLYDHRRFLEEQKEVLVGEKE